MQRTTTAETSMQVILQKGRHAPHEIFPDELLVSFSAIVPLSQASPVLPGGDAPSGAFVVATTPAASVGFPIGRIVIVGAPVKIIMLISNTKMKLIYYPAPRPKRRAADNGNPAVVAIGVICNERSRSLSREDPGSHRQVP